jgi:hypothetical protein
MRLRRPAAEEPLGVDDQLLPGLRRVGAGLGHGAEPQYTLAPLGRYAGPCMTRTGRLLKLLNLLKLRDSVASLLLKLC